MASLQIDILQKKLFPDECSHHYALSHPLAFAVRRPRDFFFFRVRLGFAKSDWASIENGEDIPTFDWGKASFLEA